MYKIIGADGREYGPVAPDVLRQWLAEGRANADTKVLPEGATEWKRLGDLPEFAPTPPSIPPLTSAPPPAQPPAPITPLTPLSSTPRTNPLATAGLVLGIISVTVGLCCYGLPFNLAGVVCSAIALVQIKKDPQREGGQGPALAGLILSLLSIILAALLAAFFFTFSGADLLRKLRRF